MEKIIQRSNLSNPTSTIDDDDIPDWLLFEILLRLPLNSVFRCRVVSKRWLSVASDRYFVRAYASRASSSSSRPPWIVLTESFGRYHRTMVDFMRNPSKNCYFIPRALYLRPQPHKRDIFKDLFSILGSSDGLVLYSCSTTDIVRLDHCHFCVCNPITGRRTQPVPFRVRDGVSQLGWGFLTRVDEEFTLKSYRIVQAMQNPNDPTAIIFSVYHSETGDWREFTADVPGPYQLKLQKSAAVLDGILYWADWGGYVIVCDPEAKPGQQVRHIRDPHSVMRPQFYDYSCIAYRGELRYFGGYACNVDAIPEFNIWKLEDFSSGKWCRVHKIEYTYVSSGVPRMSRTLEIVCLDPFDSDVVYFLDGHTRSASSYNMKSGMLVAECREMIVGADGPFSHRTLMFPCTLVLVVPPWPTVVAEKHLERRR